MSAVATTAMTYRSEGVFTKQGFEKKANTIEKRGFSILGIPIKFGLKPCGSWLGGLRLPKRTKPVCVMRKNDMLMELDDIFLNEGDLLYVMTDDAEEVRKYCMTWQRL